MNEIIITAFYTYVQNGSIAVIRYLTTFVLVNLISGESTAFSS